MGWSKAANKRATELSSEFKANLRGVADCFAGHDGAQDAVSVSHVDRAFDALASSGLLRRRWLDRPESETALGGMLIAGSFSASGIVGCFFDDPTRAISGGLFIAMFVCGAFACCHGTYRGKLPRSRAAETPSRTWARRIILALAMLATAAGLCYLGYRQMYGGGQVGCYIGSPTPAPPLPGPVEDDK